MLFTIFTATYNRASLLPRAYASVQAQTLRDFEWLIIDDGSTDNTEELVRQWQQEADFEIRYVKQPNGGKHTAFDHAGRIHRGQFMTPLDSDDELVPQALERYYYHWSNLTEQQKKEVGNIVCLTQDQNGNLVGDKFPKQTQIVDLIKMYHVKGIKGEKGGIVTSEVFSKYTFPESIRNVYIPEEVFQQQFAKDWKSLCINEVLRIYWIDERDDHDGEKMLTKANYPGNQLLHLGYLNFNMRLFWYRPRLFYVNAVFYVKLSFHLGQSVSSQFKAVKTWSGKLLWLLALPTGYFIYRKEKNRERQLSVSGSISK